MTIIISPLGASVEVNMGRFCRRWDYIFKVYNLKGTMRISVNYKTCRSGVGDRSQIFFTWLILRHLLSPHLDVSEFEMCIIIDTERNNFFFLSFVFS